MVKDSGALRKTMVALVTIVLLLSVVLTIHSISGHGLIGCSQGSHCSLVLGSRWSFLFGIIPVSALSVGVWIAFLLCLILHRKNLSDPYLTQFLRHILLILSGAVTGCAIWFIWLQHYMIRAFCPYCMTAHITGIIVSVLTVIWCIVQKTGRTALHLSVGLIIAAALAALQFTTTPQTLAERGFTNESLIYPDPQELPITGNPDAEHIITLFFDWQCSHCRHIHLMLPDAVNQSGENVAVVCCPISMSRGCNPYIPSGPDAFIGSCLLMRIGLAIWRTDREKYREYEEWFFGTDINKGWSPPTTEQATAMAEQLLGKDVLKAALQDAWIDNYTKTVNELFGRTSSNGRAAVPRLLYGSNWRIPEADDATGLASLIKTLLD